MSELRELEETFWTGMHDYVLLAHDAAEAIKDLVTIFAAIDKKRRQITSEDRATFIAAIILQSAMVATANNLGKLGDTIITLKMESQFNV